MLRDKGKRVQKQSSADVWANGADKGACLGGGADGVLPRESCCSRVRTRSSCSAQQPAPFSPRGSYFLPNFVMSVVGRGGHSSLVNSFFPACHLARFTPQRTHS